MSQASKCQLTVKLEAPLREFLERMAERDDRSKSAIVRRLVAEAQRKEAQAQEAA